MLCIYMKPSLYKLSFVINKEGDNMDYRNVLMSGMGNLDIDLNLDMDPKQFYYKQQETLREYEEQSKQAIRKLLEMDSFYFAVFFATALSERARKKTEQLETEYPHLFRTAEKDLRTVAYTARYGTNNPDVDHCVVSLLTLYGEETKDGGPPEKTLSVVRSAYPRVYSTCKAAGDTTDMKDIFFRLIHSKTEPGPEKITSDTLYLFCVMFWLFKAIGKDLSMPDGLLARAAIDALSMSEGLMPDQCGTTFDKDVKRRARELTASLNGKLAPCLQIQCNTYFDMGTFRLLNRLLAIAGGPADIIKTLETPPLLDKELQPLLEIRENTDLSEADLLVLFLAIKSFVAGMNSLRDKLGLAQRELTEYRERKAAEPPPDERLSEQRQKLSALESEKQHLKDKLRTTANNERALTAELAGLRKKVKSQEEEIQDHQRDLRELAELRETVYALMSEHDAPDAPQEDEPANYPYTDLPEGIICFGGYDQWLNRMQERFPTVRFLPVSNRYDSGILRRAPCIWIQSGYISHIMYYRIVNDARAARIETHYFNSHSVESYSRLLIETMKKHK